MCARVLGIQQNIL